MHKITTSVEKLGKIALELVVRGYAVPNKSIKNLNKEVVDLIGDHYSNEECKAFSAWVHNDAVKNHTLPYLKPEALVDELEISESLLNLMALNVYIGRCYKSGLTIGLPAFGILESIVFFGKCSPEEAIDLYMKTVELTLKTFSESL